MDNILNNNFAELSGILAEFPKYSHENHGVKFYNMPVSVRRLSGTKDIINILAKETLLSPIALTEQIPLHIFGHLRTYNNKTGNGPKLIVSLFAREILIADLPPKNDIILNGTICKNPNLRTTPLGREICDFMLAVNRKYGKSDYIPCIAWGMNAREIARKSIGDTLTVSGRLQSRKYTKIIENQAIEKTAYEVSVIEFE